MPRYRENDAIDALLEVAGEQEGFDEPGLTVKGLSSALSGKPSEVEITREVPEGVSEDLELDKEIQKDYTYRYTDFALSSDSDSDSDLDEELVGLGRPVNPFETLRKKMKDITPGKDGGVMKRILQHGYGDVIEHDARVTFHCSGQTEEETFDSSYMRGKPIKLALDEAGGEGVAGLQLGLMTMKRGETAQFLLAPKYAFGEYGVPPRIPPNQTVLYKVEVRNATNVETIEDISHTSKMKREDIPISRVIKACETVRDEAKEMHKNRRFYAAANKYEKCIHLLDEWRLLDDEDEAQQKAELLTLHLNVATVRNCLKNYKASAQAAQSAIEIDPRSSKGYYYLGVARTNLLDYEGAKAALQKAHSYRPNDKSIAQALTNIDRKESQDNMNRATMYRRMFSGLGEPTKSSNADKSGKKNPGLEALKASIRAKLTKMVESEVVSEITFPVGEFDEEEVDAVAEVAASMNLCVEPVMKGKQVQSFRISKIPAC